MRKVISKKFRTLDVRLTSAREDFSDMLAHISSKDNIDPTICRRYAGWLLSSFEQALSIQDGEALALLLKDIDTYNQTVRGCSEDLNYCCDQLDVTKAYTVVVDQIHHRWEHALQGPQEFAQELTAILLLLHKLPANAEPITQAIQPIRELGLIILPGSSQEIQSLSNVGIVAAVRAACIGQELQKDTIELIYAADSEGLTAQVHSHEVI